MFNGSRISIYPDFSAELDRKRRAFNPIKSRLSELQLSNYIRYPCTLCVDVNGIRREFTDPNAAKLAFCPTPEFSLCLKLHAGSAFDDDGPSITVTTLVCPLFGSPQ